VINITNNTDNSVTATDDTWYDDDRAIVFFFLVNMLPIFSFCFFEISFVRQILDLSSPEQPSREIAS